MIYNAVANFGIDRFVIKVVELLMQAYVIICICGLLVIPLSIPAALGCHYFLKTEVVYR